MEKFCGFPRTARVGAEIPQNLGDYPLKEASSTGPYSRALRAADVHPAITDVAVVRKARMVFL